MDGNSFATAAATPASSSFMRRTICSGVIWSISTLAALGCSVASPCSVLSDGLRWSLVAIGLRSLPRLDTCSGYIVSVSCLIAVHIGQLLAEQLLASEVGVEDILIAAIHRTRVLNRLVSLRVRCPTCV